MKPATTIHIIFFSFVFQFNAQAQLPKYDYNWVYGQAYYYKDSISGREFGGSLLHFADSGLQSTQIDISMVFDVMNTSISDINGALQFYSNGCEIYDFKDRKVANTDSLTEGAFSTSFCYADYEQFGATISPGIAQGMIGLPHPEHVDRYFVLYVDTDFSFDVEYVYSQCLWLAELERNPLDSTFELLQKVQLVEGSHWDEWTLAAVKHTQKNHWWIIMKNLLDQTTDLINFYSADSFSYKQIVLPEDSYAKTGSTRWSFAPDGNTAVMSDFYQDIYLYDFDRSTGKLTFRDSLEMGETYNRIKFVAYAPESRFLYAWFTDTLYQFDLHASDISASRELIGVYDGFEDPFPAKFSFGQSGPDCRLYISVTSSSQYMHIIDHPDRKGIACGFRQHGLHLPGVNYGTLPYYPNYRLDLGPVCDSTLTAVVIPFAPGPRLDFIVSPNPAWDWISLSLRGDAISHFSSIHLYDLNGKLVRTWKEAYAWQDLSLDVRGLVAGMYVIEMRDAKKARSIRKKLVIGGN